MNRGPANRFVSNESSSTALRRFFAWIESRYGGLPVDENAQILVSNDRRLHKDHLLSLMRHEALAVHVPGFYPLGAARQLGTELAAQPCRNWKVSTSRGLESSDVFTVGEYAPFNVAAASDSPQQREDYFAGVWRELEHRRWELQKDSTIVPQLWPLDLLRLQLDEAWPAGAGLSRDEQQRPFGGGLARIMKGPTRWSQGYIHVDEMALLNPNKGLFSANIYLQLPRQQESSNNDNKSTVEGEPQQVLHIWPVDIRTRWDWYRNALLLSGLSSQDPEDQIRLWTALGEPTTIAVNPGDLVLLCVQRPHAAIGFRHGVRVSLQCFVQHNGMDHRLLIDS